MNEERRARLVVGAGGWNSGPMGDVFPEPALSVVADVDADLVEIMDGTGILLSLSFAQAQDVADQLDIVLGERG